MKEFITSLEPTSFSVVETSLNPIIFENGNYDTRNKLIGFDKCSISFTFSRIQYMLFNNFVQELNYIEPFQADFMKVGELREYTIIGDINQSQNDNNSFNISFEVYRRRVECEKVDKDIITEVDLFISLLQGSDTSINSRIPCKQVNIDIINEVDQMIEVLQIDPTYNYNSLIPCSYENKLIISEIDEFIKVLQIGKYEIVEDGRPCEIVNINLISEIDKMIEILQITDFNSDNDGATIDCVSENVSLISEMDLFIELLSDEQLSQNQNTIDSILASLNLMDMALNTDKTGGCDDVNVQLISAINSFITLISDELTPQDQIIVNKIIGVT